MLFSARRTRVVALAVSLTSACAGYGTEPQPLTARVPLHLEDHLEAASIDDVEVPEGISDAVAWRFDRLAPQPHWRPVVPPQPERGPIQAVQIDDGLRLILREEAGRRGAWIEGGIYVDVPASSLDDWAYVEVRARAAKEFTGTLRLGINLSGDGNEPRLFDALGPAADLIQDGTVNTYRLRLPGISPGESMQHLGLVVGATEPGTVDILSLRLVSLESTFNMAPTGMRTVQGRRAIFTHAPSRLRYLVMVPPGGRLDLGLGVLLEKSPVSFEVSIRPVGGIPETLLQHRHKDPARWEQASVDLSHLAGKVATLTLETSSVEAGAVAFWGAPTLTGVRDTDRPNVILYIIDAGGSDYMSAYGYNRPTTPNLERLAAEGAIFEAAYSNSTWTAVSTGSFLTSLQNTALGGFRSWSAPMVPEEAVPLAQHMHLDGYQTALLTTNGLAVHSGGIDILRYRNDERFSRSSRVLNEEFWRWRHSYPGEPYYVRFQTTDVGNHTQALPEPPFAGLFIDSSRRKRYFRWTAQVNDSGGYANGMSPYDDSLDQLGIDRIAYYAARRDLYDENLAHNDAQLGRLVEGLKASGEWNNTLLIIASDHGSHSHQTLGMMDPLPPQWLAPGEGLDWRAPMLGLMTRIPLVVVWPGGIEGGQRFSDPVSMIDVLPTILDLAGLPPAEIAQGQSLAPLLRGESGWDSRPVFLDEFYLDTATGRLRGLIEVIDGRWGASLEINQDPEAPVRRPVPLLLFDLWNDPYCLTSLHESRPELAKHYADLLEAQWQIHQELQLHLTGAEESALTAEDIDNLRALGYIQ